MTEQVVNYYLKKGFLVSPDLLTSLTSEIQEKVPKLANEKIKNSKHLAVLNKDLFYLINHSLSKLEINWSEFEKSRLLLEKGKDTKNYKTFLDLMDYNISPEKKEELNSLLQEVKIPQQGIVEEINSPEEETYPVIILKSYNKPPEKKDVQDFVGHYKARYNSLKKILASRPELATVISINRLYNKQNREEAALIGIVIDKSITKNNHLLFSIEDITGTINVMVSQKKEELYTQAKDILVDEVIGIKGTMGEKIVFATQLFIPDIPKTNILKKSPHEVYAAFISDVHIGSRLFLEEDLLKFIRWLNLESGNEGQKELAKKVKYLFIAGDLVDGIGIFPSQYEELAIPDITEQYNKAAEILSKVRKDINMILIPGNHDAGRISEPQPPLNKQYAEKLYEIPNLTITTNPSLVNIASTPEFEGINVLVYHGYSYDFYAEQVESIRRSGIGISHRVSSVMKYLLQRRHLAPVHGSTLFIPDKEEDPLVIDKIPDIFVSGHIHKADIISYNNVTLICSSCWQSRSDFQEKTGHTPEPGRVPLVNLKTRETKMLKFIQE